MVKIVYTREDKSLIFQNEKKDLYDYIKDINIDEESFKWFTNIENQKIENLELEDLYIYDNIPLYYFERPTIYLNFKHVVSCFFMIKNIIEDVQESVEVESDDIIFLEICSKIFHLKCNKVLLENPTSNASTVKHKKFKLLLRIARGVKNQIKFKFKSFNKKNVLVISNVMNLNLLKMDNKEEFVDTQIGPVVSKLQEDFNVFNMQCMFNFNMLDKGLAYEEDSIPFEFFAIYKKIKGKKIINEQLINSNLDKLEKINWNYEAYNLKDIMMKYVFNNLKNRYTADLIEILCAEKFIEKHNIKKCILTDEGDRPRCFVTACNRKNVESFAIQHGIINEVSPAYIINSKYNNIIPKCTFVWGEKYKNMLKKLSNLYKSSNVEAVGQVRTDYLMNYLQHKKDNNCRIKILYATQYFKDLLVPATDMLFNALNSMEKDYEIIVKLHPADQYYDIYKSKAEEKGIKNLKIVKDGDLYELLSWCDVVVSVHSTVVVEGALLEKPSICIRLPKYDDAGGFIRDGLSIGVNDEIELKNYLTNIDNYKLDEKFNCYMKNNFYKVDGKVTQRISSAMTNLTKE